MRKLRKVDYPSYKYIPIDLGNGDKPITFKNIADLVPPPTGDAEEIYFAKIRSYDKYQKLTKVLLGRENDSSFGCPFTDIYKKFGFTFDD